MQTNRYSAFADHSKKIAVGDLASVAETAKSYLVKHAKAQVIIFDDRTSEQVEVDFRGTSADVRKRIDKLMVDPGQSEASNDKKVGPGRPKLGVVAREVTLLPQHWEWLSTQPGGASVTLRKLVDAAKKKYQSRDELRRAQEITYKFLLVVAGDRPHYEDALRALYAQDKAKFKKLMDAWPKDVREHALSLAEPVFKT